MKYLVCCGASDGMAHLLNVMVIDADTEANAKSAACKRNNWVDAQYVKDTMHVEPLDALGDGWCYYG